MRDDDHDPLAPPEWVNTGVARNAVTDPGDDGPEPEWWDTPGPAGMVASLMLVLAGCAAWARDPLALAAAVAAVSLAAANLLDILTGDEWT